MLEAIRALRPILAQIERHDRDLGNQLRRAAASVVLNLAESDGVSGGNRTLRRRTALGSAYEVRSALESAAAFGYADGAEDVLALLDRVCALTYRLSR